MKTYDMMKYGYAALAQFPKSEKFALVQEIKHSLSIMMRLIIAASKRYHKKTTLQDLDIELMILRYHLRLALDLGFLPPKKYEVWSSMVVEIGKMLGGWIKQVNK